MTQFGNTQDSPARASTPRTSNGTAAPLTTPSKIGDIYVDTVLKKVYVGTGTASSADWTITN